ncbi:MAG: hypothetical protein LH632_07170 [Rhodoferax sp.]|nr:hypothetical protein [Rhodoferax sp.]
MQAAACSGLSVRASSESASPSASYVDPSSSTSTPRRVSNFIKRPMTLVQQRLERYIGGCAYFDKDRLTVGAPVHAVQHQAVRWMFRLAADPKR